MSRETYIEAGKRIRSVRESKKLTREYVAFKAGISAKFLYEIEHGVKGFSADNLYKISKALDISCEYVLGGHSSIDFEDELIEVLNLFTNEQLKEIISVLKTFYKIFK